MSKNMKVLLKQPIYLAEALVVSLALALLLSGCFGGIGRPTGSVAGYIIVPTSETRGANIRVTPEQPPALDPGYKYGVGASILVQSGSWSGMATADEHGYFNIPGVPTGTATVTITYGSYRVEATVYVQAGQRNLIGDPDQGFRLRKWTVMVYMCADNSLGTGSPSPDTLDLTEMEDVGSTLNVSIVVQHDRPGHGAGKGVLRYYIGPGNAKVVYDWGRPDGSYELDMGNPNTLRDFVSWAKQNYPAQNYLLVLWNHGDGWQIHPPARIRTQIAQRAICIDDDAKTALNVDELARALGGSNNVDVLAMDACLMQMAEVAYEVKEVADVMVGSEELTPGEGYPYDTILRALTQNPGMTPEALARTICKKFAAQYQVPFTFGGYSYSPTQSAVNLTRVREFADRVSSLTGAIATAVSQRYETQVKNALISARSNATEFGKGADSPFYSFDLYQFAAKLDGDLSGSGNQYLRAIGTSAGAITSFFTSLVYDYYSAQPGPGGLAIYIPPKTDISSYYRSMRFVGNTGWDRVFQYID